MSQPINLQPIGMAEITGPRKSDFRKLTLGSIGVVYGDIGTSSPLCVQGIPFGSVCWRPA